MLCSRLTGHSLLKFDCRCHYLIFCRVNVRSTYLTASKRLNSVKAYCDQSYGHVYERELYEVAACVLQRILTVFNLFNCQGGHIHHVPLSSHPHVYHCDTRFCFGQTKRIRIEKCHKSSCSGFVVRWHQRGDFLKSTIMQMT